MLFRRARDRMRCRNTDGCRSVLDVAEHVDEHGPAVTLHVNNCESPLVLDPLTVGWLRARLRDALIAANMRAEREQARREEWQA